MIYSPDHGAQRRSGWTRYDGGATVEKGKKTISSVLVLVDSLTISCRDHDLNKRRLVVRILATVNR